MHSLKFRGYRQICQVSNKVAHENLIFLRGTGAMHSILAQNAKDQVGEKFIDMHCNHGITPRRKRFIFEYVLSVSLSLKKKMLCFGLCFQLYSNTSL